MTTYYYVTQILSGPGGTVVDQSSDCSFDTLVPVPAASCSAATDLAATTMTLNGAATNTVAGNVVRFRYGTATGVYTITTAEQGAAASFTEAVTGLTTLTDYFYVAEILDAAGGTVISTSAECTGATLSAIASCSAATDLAATTMTLNGAATNTVAGNVVRFRYGTATGVYTITTAEQGAAASFTEAVTGLTTLTDYFYVAEILDAAGGTVISTSAECTGTTTAVTTGLFAASTNTTGSLGPAVTIGVGDYIYSTHHYTTTPLVYPVSNIISNATIISSSLAGLLNSTHGAEVLNTQAQAMVGTSVASFTPVRPFGTPPGAGVIVVSAAEATGWAAAPSSAAHIAGIRSLLNSSVPGPYTTTTPSGTPRSAGKRQIATLDVSSTGGGIPTVVMSSIPAGWVEITDYRHRITTAGGNTIDRLAFVGPYLVSPSFDTTIDYTAAGGAIGLIVMDIS